MDSADTLIEQMDRDGFVFFRNFFTPDVATRARAELEVWYEKDRQDRAAKGVTSIVHRGAAGVSQMRETTHLLIDVYGKSLALDGMFEKILTDPVSSRVLEAIGGKRLKLRGYNIRRMTGVHDDRPRQGKVQSLPHEWHRDSPGEIGFGIFLSDNVEGGNAGTALLPGSHRFPYCPRWNTLWWDNYYTGNVHGMGQPGLRMFTRLNIFNNLLARRVLKNPIEATGKRGDFYIFFNDVWHGRAPNIRGAESMVVLIGAFPTEFPYPDEVALPPESVIRTLPPTMRRVIRQDQPPNTERTSLLHRMLDGRPKPGPLSLFRLAQLERNLACRISLSRKLAKKCVRGVTDLLRSRSPEDSSKVKV